MPGRWFLRAGVVLTLFFSGCSGHRANTEFIERLKTERSFALEVAQLLDRSREEAAVEARKIERAKEVAAVRATLPPAVIVPVQGSPSRGPATARLTVVAFLDFECPYAAATYFDLLGLQAKYRDSVRVVFKHLPLSSHRQARLAATAAEIARDQGKFWEFSSALFHEQDFLSYPFLREIARKVGIDMSAFNRALEHRRRDFLARVERDLADARSLGVTASPTVFFNGLRFNGHQGAEAYTQLVEAVVEGD